jgi:hypothetical protein
MKQTGQNKIDDLTRAIEKLIAKEVAPVAVVAPVAPVLPIAPVLNVNPEDHNLLIKLDGKVDALKDDIKVLNDGTTLRLADHETRIRLTEASITRIMSYGTALIIFVGIIEFLINKFVK